MSGLAVKIAMGIVEKAKPILLKIFPSALLRQAKKWLITQCLRKNALDPRKPYDRDKLEDGMNIIGLVRNESGMGQSCRLMIDAVAQSGLKHTVYNYVQVSSSPQRDVSVDDKITNTAPYNMNLVHINPTELALAKGILPQEVWDYKYNIGFWLWEIEHFPEEWKNSFQYVDEIWTPSEYVSNIMRKQTDLPVHTMIYPINADTEEQYDRAHFQLPESCFLYMIMYDCNSTMLRKNPMAAIEAYKKAFPPENKEVGLVIKVNGSNRKDMDTIKTLCQGYENIFIIEGTLSKVEVNSLIKAVDVLVSMHRAEGFGLPMAEAMVVGTATIGTNWSSNTEFMKEDRACMVGYDLIQIEEADSLYPKGAIWADAHVEDATKHMRHLYEDAEFYDSIVANAKAYMELHYSQKAAGEAVYKRVQEIRGAV